MCKIPDAIRVKGRYIFRRRVHFQNIMSKPVVVALRTADPKVARRRAALMAARFSDLKLSVETVLELNQALTGDEIEAIFRQELEVELTRNLHDAYENAPWSSSVGEAAQVLAEASTNAAGLISGSVDTNSSIEIASSLGSCPHWPGARPTR